MPDRIGPALGIHRAEINRTETKTEEGGSIFHVAKGPRLSNVPRVFPSFFFYIHIYIYFPLFFLVANVNPQVREPANISPEGHISVVLFDYQSRSDKPRVYFHLAIYERQPASRNVFAIHNFRAVSPVVVDHRRGVKLTTGIRARRVSLNVFPRKMMHDRAKLRERRDWENVSASLAPYRSPFRSIVSTANIPFFVSSLWTNA